MEVKQPGEEEEQEKVAGFMEIVGETSERARQFLEATGWHLEEAIQLYFAESHEGGGSRGPLSTSVSVPSGSLIPAGPSSPGPQPLGPTASTDSSRDVAGDDYVRPPLPVKREALYEDIFQYRAHRMAQTPNQPTSVDAFRNFEDEASQRPGWGTGEASSNTNMGLGAGLQNSLAALYRPPFVLIFQGTFEQAKTEAARQGKWLLVNLQSTKEFSSYMLNRDTWAHEAVKETIGTSFVFWQCQLVTAGIQFISRSFSDKLSVQEKVYDDTEEGRKVCTYYKLIGMPTTLVLDPLTGQKMRAWEGMISAERLLEDLVPYMDRGPMERQPLGVPPQKRARESSQQYMQPSKDDIAHIGISVDQDEDEELRRALAASLENVNALVPDAGNQETTKVVEGVADGQSQADNVTSEAIRPIAYPELPEEPDSRNLAACRVAVRFPDGRRGQRRFLKSDPIKFLWTFCSSQVKEAAEGRKFHLNHTIPGATGILDYSSDASMLEAGVANSMLSMTWD